MKKRIYGILMAAAVLSIATAGLGKANAYFTTYAKAQGANVIHMIDETTVKERVVESEKILEFTNKAGSAEAVFVRARAYAPSEIQNDLVYSKNWVAGSDGWYYYPEPVAPGVTLTDEEGKALHISIKKPEADVEGKEFNVIVVYETIPAAGNSYDSADDWNQAESSGWSIDKE